MSVNRLRSRFLTFLLLACFLLAKGSFWIALLPAGPGQKDAQSSHPCACSGAAVCNCGPGGCCDSSKPSNLTSVAESNQKTDNQTKLQTPKVCGHLGLGMGPVGEGPGFVTPTESLLTGDQTSVRIEMPIVIAPLDRFEAPDPPPPRA